MIAVQVTPDDIEAGIPGDPCRCALGTALLRVTGRLWILDGTACARETESLFTVPLPQSCERFQSRFDFGDPVEPFTFEFEPRMLR